MNQNTKKVKSNQMVKKQQIMGIIKNSIKIKLKNQKIYMFKITKKGSVKIGNKYEVKILVR